MMQAVINIRAQEVRDNHNGTFTLFVPAREISDAEREMIEKLLPNTSEAFFKLLTTEALIASVATSSEVAKAPEKGRKPGKAFDAPIEADRR